MAALARAGWRDLEAATGRRLLHVTGQVTLGDEATVGAIAARWPWPARAADRISAAEAARRFPGIAPTGPVLVEPDSGVLVADDCLRAFGEAGGFGLHTACPVTSLRQSPHSVTVGTAGGDAFGADVVVDCAGTHTLALAGVGSAVAAAPSLPQVAYFRTRRPGDTAPPSSSSGARTWSTACRWRATGRTPAPTRCPTTRRGRRSRASTPRTRHRWRPTTRRS